MQVRKKKKNNKTRHKIRKKNHLFVFYFTHVQLYIYVHTVCATEKCGFSKYLFKTRKYFCIRR